MLLSGSEHNPSLISEAIRSFSQNLEPYFANGLLRSESDVIEALQKLPDLKYLKPLAYCKTSLKLDTEIIKILQTNK